VGEKLWSLQYLDPETTRFSWDHVPGEGVTFYTPTWHLFYSYSVNSATNEPFMFLATNSSFMHFDLPFTAIYTLVLSL
jgi:hypothetical protein